MKSFVITACAVSLLGFSSVVLSNADTHIKGNKVIVKASEISEITLHVGEFFRVHLPIENEEMLFGGGPVAHWQLNAKLSSANALVQVSQPKGKSVLIKAVRPGCGLLVGEYVRYLKIGGSCVNNHGILPPMNYEVIDRTVVCKITVLP